MVGVETSTGTVFFIICKKGGLIFYHDIFEGIHFVMDGIRGIMVFNPFKKSRFFLS